MDFPGKLVVEFFPPSIRNDEDNNRIVASYLRVILMVIVIILPAYVVLKIFDRGEVFPSDYIISALVIFNIAIYYILRRGKVVLAGNVFLLSSWIGFTLLACFADGVKDIAIVGYIVIIFLSTLIAGFRFAYLITAIDVLFLIPKPWIDPVWFPIGVSAITIITITALYLFGIIH